MTHAAGRAERTILIASDTGPGIPEAGRGRVVDLFFRRSTQGTDTGNGSEPALVRALADRLGTSVTFLDAQPTLRVEISSVPVYS